jgi:hypothetical protein
MQRARTHLSFANVISLIALFVALGGTTYAAVTLPKNSVGAKQIKKNAVRASEVRKNAIRSGEVRDGALLLRDFRAGQLPPGPPGPQGVQGPAGGPIAQVTVQYEQASSALADNTSASYDVNCPAGQQGIAGGWSGDPQDPEFTNTGSSRPRKADGNAPADGESFIGWRATVFNPSGGAPPAGDITPEVWVVCAPAPAP